jgi:bifunctional UDP-N-acetylglucosamine pyrophosphorylase/glucosamine-1-phosphate N-acetyltransferase
MTGASSLINKDVLPHALVFGVPARFVRTLPASDDVAVEDGKKE